MTPCALCGTDISDLRADAVFCSPAHRAEASRLKRLLCGQEVDGYRSVAERLNASQRRTDTDSAGPLS